MSVALWTPPRPAAWLATLAAGLERTLEREFAFVHAEPPTAPLVDLDLYHLAGDPEFGFVYRALLRRPGIVLLEEWRLHALVHAETAGRGEAAAYRREARYCHGDAGAFVARQVLAGLGGALPALIAMNQRVLEHSLALVVFGEDVASQARALLPGRTVLWLSKDEGADAAAKLAALVAEVAPRAVVERRAITAREELSTSPLGSALAELGWAGRELGLAEPPEDARALVAGLFGTRT